MMARHGTEQDDCVLFAVEHGIGRITLNRPDRLNALSLAMHHRLSAILDEIERRNDLRVLLLIGAGRAFCAGQDLSERPVEQTGAPLDLGESLELRYNPLVRRLMAVNVPLLCAVNGVAAGAGAGLALLADMVIAAESARLILSFTRIGLMPDCGVSWLLPRLIGQPRALGMALTGDAIPARQAEAWGMIWQAVPDAAFSSTVEAMLQTLAQAPTQALMATRHAMRGAWLRDLDAQLELERDEQRRLGLTEDYREGVSAFRDKRQPQFRAR